MTLVRGVPRLPSADRPAPIRKVLHELDDEAAGAAMHALIRELYPICRSITGEGLRETLRIVQRVAPLELHEVPSGTHVLDWTVPREWNLRRARLIDPDGHVIADTDRLNLHVVNYSVPFHGTMMLEELDEHLHSLPAQPTVVPYRTSYYRDDWGFCLRHEERERLRPGRYTVAIDTTLAEGALTYGELVLPGASPKEFLISTHCCHPSLANDNLSGVALAATLASMLERVDRRYTYRFVFVPGTIGSITWLGRNPDAAKRVSYGLVIAGVGSAGAMTYKRSRRGGADIDRVVAHVLAHRGEPYETRDFTPYGYDERQYCSPGFDLPVGCLSRTPYGEYPEYHTSADDLGFIRADRLVDALRCSLEVLEVIEANDVYVNLSPYGEPQLGKRGLYGHVGGGHARADELALLWVLNLADGTRTLLEIAERSQLAFDIVARAADALCASGLLARAEDA